MIARIILTLLLASVLIYAASQRQRSRTVSALAVFTAVAGLYFVWIPEHATRLAEWAGVGRGVDLILYVWVVISLLLLVNLHLKLRMQAEMITALARSIALSPKRGRNDLHGDVR
jgi:hypothetical protein